MCVETMTGLPVRLAQSAAGMRYASDFPTSLDHQVAAHAQGRRHGARHL